MPPAFLYRQRTLIYSLFRHAGENQYPEGLKKLTTEGAEDTEVREGMFLIKETLIYLEFPRGTGPRFSRTGFQAFAEMAERRNNKPGMQTNHLGF